MNLCGLGSVGRIRHRALFYLGDLGRDADNDARVDECPALVRLLDEVVEHLLGDFEVGNHAVFHGLDNPEIAGRTAQHLLGFLADCLDFAGTVVEGNGRGLVDHDALLPGIDPRVDCTQVNCQVRREQAQQSAQIVEGDSGCPVKAHTTNWSVTEKFGVDWTTATRFGRTPYQTSAGGLSTLYSDSRPRGPLDTLREECSRRKQRSPRLKTSRAELRAQARREHSVSYERSGKKTNMRNLIGQADLGFVVLIATIAMPLVVPQEASGTAQFSRQYNTSCNTCHTRVSVFRRRRLFHCDRTDVAHAHRRSAFDQDVLPRVRSTAVLYF